MPAPEEVYSALLDVAQLSPIHRQELKEKRGFTDETIAASRFFSGGRYLQKAIFNLQNCEKFTKEDLLAAKILTKGISKTGEEDIHPLPKLLDERSLIIPYLSEIKGCFHLRPHKNGLPESGAQLYWPKIGRGNRATIAILCESEFKATAMAQIYGDHYHYLGFNGICSHAGKNFRFIREDLPEKVSRAIIIFDTEDKTNPHYHNYKPDFWKRYDAEYWAYIITKRLKEIGIEALIATLPEEWMVNGKADCDGALAQGRGRGDFDPVLEAALPPNEYVESLTGEKKWAVKKLIRRGKRKTRFDINEDGYFSEKEEKEEA